MRDVTATALWTLAPIAGLLILAPAPAAAQQDVVVLTSGNRLVGSVVELDRGRLTFSIDGAGVVGIDWSNVRSLESSQRLEIELASGDRVLGTLGPASSGELEIVAETRAEAAELGDVRRLYRVGATAAERTSGYIDLGFTLSSANDETDATLNAQLRNRTHNYLTQAELNLLVRRFDDETVQERYLLDFRSRRYLSNRWFLLGELWVERNRELGLDSRALAGIAAGRTFVQTHRTVASAYGGIDYDVERYRGISGAERAPEVFGSLEWDWFEAGRSTELTSKATVYASLDDDRVRYEVSASLRRQAFGGFHWSMIYYRSYTSEPPPGLQDHDYGLAIALGRSF